MKFSADFLDCLREWNGASDGMMDDNYIYVLSALNVFSSFAFTLLAEKLLIFDSLHFMNIYIQIYVYAFVCI